MRSRYTAYTRQDKDYLIACWHPTSRPVNISFDDQQRWLGLKIVNTSGGARTDDSGEVEFIARYKINGKAVRLHERSRFVKLDGKWFYIDGVVKT